VNPKDEAPAPNEEDVLHSGIRRIVLSRETIPRTPRWTRAFRRTLLRLARTIREAEASSPSDANAEIPPTEERHDDRS
jgi:hypothetical protein